MPDIIKVPEALPSKQPPPPGHDMKTLRKQIEFLYSEVQYRTENYNSICHQNEQLWSYATQLLEANKDNAVKMREHVKRLSEELRIVYKERMEYAEKLALAKNSQEMLLSLNKELEETSLTKEEMDKRRREAQAELIKAKSEREELHQMLQEKLHQVENYQSMLDEYRLQKLEEESLERADDFFFSNRIVLKAAYSRFRKGVKKRLREQKIYELFQGLYFSYLKSKCWRQWLHHRKIERFSRKSLLLRKKETLLLFFTKWKVFQALELLFHRAHRKLLLTNCFNEWVVFLRERREEKKRETRLSLFQNSQIKRKVFLEWKRSVVFLSWFARETVGREESASNYFLLKLFRAWQRVVHRDQTLRQEREHRLGLFRLRSHWRSWFDLCHRLWKMRGRLLRRFFGNLRRSLGDRSRLSQLSRQARIFQLSRQRSSCLEIWRKWTLSRRRDKVQRMARQSQVSSQRLRLLRQSFLQMRYLAAVNRRAKISDLFAARYLWQQQVGSVWSRWTRWALGRGLARRRFLLKQFQRWVSALRAERDRRRRSQQRALLFLPQEQKIARLRMILAIQRWFDQIKERKLGLFVSASLALRRERAIQRKWWRTWKDLFARRLFWKLKEQTVELQRVSSLATLFEEQFSAMTQDQQKLQEENRSCEEAILQLQELIASKTNQLERQVTTIREQEEDKAALEQLLRQLREQIEALEVEREQWRLLETSYRQEKEKDQTTREKRRLESQSRLQRLQQQSQTLQSQLEQDLSLHDSQLLEEQERLEELSSLLSEREQDKAQSLLSLEESEQEVKQLESDEESLHLELEKVQKKMREISEESQGILRENQKQLRERVSEVRVLREDAGLAQARVTALLEIASDFKSNQERGKMDLSELHDQELREMENLKSIQLQHQRQLSELRASPVSPPYNSDLAGETASASASSTSSDRLKSSEVEFKDARETIRLLSQRLSHSLSSPVPLSPIKK